MSSVHRGILYCQSSPISDTSPAFTENLSNSVLLRFCSRYSIRHGDIAVLPLRGLKNFLALLPGAVNVNGALHIRGRRAGEIAYHVDGIPATNRFFNAEAILVIPEATD